jgi:hypothetical protein
VRVRGGDGPIDWPKITRAEQLAPLLSRGGNIRKIIAEQVLDKKIKALAIYGSGYCVKSGMGFPGGGYPPRIPSGGGRSMAFLGRKESKPGQERLRSKTGRPISSSPAPNGKMFPPDRCFRRDATKRSMRSFIKATCPTSLSRQIRPLSERNIGPKSNGGIALRRRRLSFFAAADRRSFLKIAFLMILVFDLKDFFDASDPGANDGHRKQF